MRRVRAEDESGAFAVLPGHIDLLTVLSVGVASWRDAAGVEHHVALRGGVLLVDSRGQRVRIATPEAILCDDLAKLETEVLEQMKSTAMATEASRVASAQLERGLMREVSRFANPRLRDRVRIEPGATNLRKST